MILDELITTRYNVSDVDFEKAKSYQVKFGGRLEQILVNMGSLPEDQVPLLFSEYLELPLINIGRALETVTKNEFPDQVLKVCLDNKWIPIDLISDTWHFAVEDLLIV